MQINWCLKGIAEDKGFGDAEAAAVLATTGILSKWMLANSAKQTKDANVDAQNALTTSALDDHVNNYAKVARDTPFISLSAGCREYLGPRRPPLHHPALHTAIGFATRWGRQAGYVFRCWVITGLQPAAELPGLAEEVRDLNLFGGFFAYHTQGEVTAKLVVPRRQIHWVVKYGPNRRPVNTSWPTVGARMHLYNWDFVTPDLVSNFIADI